jgi:hypothetical protein
MLNTTAAFDGFFYLFTLLSILSSIISMLHMQDSQFSLGTLVVLLIPHALVLSWCKTGRPTSDFVYNNGPAKSLTVRGQRPNPQASPKLAKVKAEMDTFRAVKIKAVKKEK